MANVQINWTAYTPDPGDVDAVEIHRSNTLTTETEFQAALDAGTIGTAEAITSISGADITSTATYTDTTAASGNTYYYCLAARNAGGYKVGVGDDALSTTAPASSGVVEGAVARVDV